MPTKRKSVRFVEDVVPTDAALLRMSKRRRDDNDDGTGREEEGAYGDIGRKLEPRPGEKQGAGTSQHTLDSDEEEEEKYDRLNVADVEGQEDATLEFDEETKITPFNMNEEMDEGHFDSDGTFIFNKNKEQIKDAWLDNIDWAKIKKDAGGLWQGEEIAPGGGDDESSRSSVPVDRMLIYENILQFLQPQETITKALKRLGGSRKMSDVRKGRWRERKRVMKSTAEEIGNEKKEDCEQQESASASVPLDEKAAAVTKLTELVDSLVTEGELEVYGYTYEKINHELDKCRKHKAAEEARVEDIDKVKTSGTNDDTALDMFADEIDVKKLNSESASTQKQEDASRKEQETSEASCDVLWEFKWKNEDAAETYGPWSSQQMQQWTDDGYFKDGVWVRRVGQENAQFYSSHRIDFELYV